MWILLDTIIENGIPCLVEKREISVDEVFRIKNLFSFADSYSVVKMMEDVVIKNHHDYGIHMHPNNLLQYRDKLTEAIVIANQCALNYATSIQSFIDVTERQLKISNRTEKELTLYNRFQSQMYDTHVEYRFWMRLRNFIVHCGFPYTKIIHNSEGLEILCPKSHLLSSGKWNAVKQDILKMPEYVRIETMIVQMTSCIRALRLAFVGIYAEDIARASVEYTSFCKLHDVREPVFVEVDSEDAIGLGAFSFNPLPVSELLSALKDLKNVPFIKLNQIPT